MTGRSIVLDPLPGLLHGCIWLAAGQIPPDDRIAIDLEAGGRVVQHVLADDQSFRFENEFRH